LQALLINEGVKVSWVLTAIISFCVLVTVFLYYAKVIDIEELSAYGSIVAAAGSIVAIIWFYNSLQQQAQQLNEQREEFKLEFESLKLEGKRNTIALVRTLLNDMENDINTSLGEFGRLENLSEIFIAKFFPLLEVISGSLNAGEVFGGVEEANKILYPTKNFISTLKLISSLFLENEGVAQIDDSLTAEDFVLHYRERIEKMPLLSKYLPNAILLAEFMGKVDEEGIEIARKVSLLLLKPQYLDEAEVLGEVEKMIVENKKLPAVARMWRDKRGAKGL